MRIRTIWMSGPSSVDHGVIENIEEFYVEYTRDGKFAMPAQGCFIRFLAHLASGKWGYIEVVKEGQ